MGGLDVRGAMMRAPWWALSLLSGVLFGLARFAFERAGDGSVAGAALSAAVQGVLFGLVMGPLLRRINRRSLAAMGDLPQSEQRQVRRAAVRGPVPQDPEVRRASLSFVEHQIATITKMWWAILMWVALIGLSCWLAWAETAWWSLAAVFFAGFLGLHLWTIRRLRVRRELLAG